jgi:PAS domain S-box-containing protein
MNSNPGKTKDAAKADELLRLELERCQRELDKSRGRVGQLEGLFTHMADAIFVTELDGQIIDVNPAACAMLGYEASELLGKHPWDFVTSAPREEILALIQKMKIGTPVAVQRIYRCKTGEQKLLDLRLTRFNHSERDLIIASCRDITEQKRLEDRLRQSERNLAEGQRLTKTGSWILDFKTGNTDWSVETCRIFGFPDPPPSPHYSEFRARVRPEDRDGVDQGLRESFETGEPQPLKYIFILPDGTRKNIETISQAVRDDDGKLKLMGTVMDVTERVKVQEALQKSEAYLTEAQCLSRTGSFSWKPASGEVLWSAETFRIFGFDPSVKPTLELAQQRIHPDDAGMFADKVRSGVQEGKDLEYEHRLLMPDGTVKWLQVVARAARDESGKVEYVGALMDITERTQAAEALRAAEHLARGQLEALTDTLAVITQESKPEKFLEHVLRVICQQLDATGVSVWENDSKFGCIHQVASFEENTLRLPTPDKMELIPQEGLGASPHPVWSDFFRDGNFCVYCQIDVNPLRVLVAKDPNGPWHENFAVAAPNLAGINVCQRISNFGVKGTLIIPMLVAGKVTGFFSTRFNQMRSFRQEEIELTRAMSHQAMLAIQLIRLSQLNRETAIVAERNRMARDIHDTLAQGFTGIIMQLEAAKGSAERSDLTEIIKRIERAGELARSSLGEARRSVLALRPRSLRGVTLCMALDNLLKRMSDGSDLRAEFQVTGNEQALPVDWQEELLHIAQESLTNTVKHASARNFKATLNFGAKEVQLQLVDDGRGFDLRAEHDGFGLIGMKERVDRLAGRFTLRSKPDEGTEILVILSNPNIFKPTNGNE